MYFEFKACIVGDMGVGKSQLAQLFALKSAPARNSPSRNILYSGSTIGVDLFVPERSHQICPQRSADHSKCKTSHETRSCKYQLWDTAGQERYRACTASYLRGVHAAIFVYDVTDIGSFHGIRDYWYEEVQRHASVDCKFFIVGTKTDMPGDHQIDMSEVQNFAEQIGAVCFETNAVQEGGVKAYDTFTAISQMMAESADTTQARHRLGGPHVNEQTKIIIGRTKKPKKKKCAAI